jgi:GGDEF domain-containing protein
MWNGMTPRSTTLRTAWALSSMLLSSAAIAAGASAQSVPALPTTDGLPSGGVELGTGPDGVKLGLDAGDTGGVTVGAGPNGVDLGLRTTPKSSASPSAPEPDKRVSVPGGPTQNPRSGTSPGQSVPGTGRGGTIAVEGNGPGSSGSAARGRAADRRRTARSAAAARLDNASSAARAKRDDKGAVAPVFDLVERIPAAVRAGLLALALIALAMWALWVRGRRRLQHNAYLDPDTEIANMAAFEQMLDREWQRATRYRRPLGLLLLELERGPGGLPLPGERAARDAVDTIGEEVRQADTVARLAPTRFAVICPEGPQGSMETLAHAIEHRLEERRLRCWVGFADRNETDVRPADLVARAATALAQVQSEVPAEDMPAAEAEAETRALTQVVDRVAAA